MHTPKSQMVIGSGIAFLIAFIMPPLVVNQEVHPLQQNPHA